MQPKKNDCTEKNLHTFIDKAVCLGFVSVYCIFFERANPGRTGAPTHGPFPAGTAKPGNTQRAYHLRSYAIWFQNSIKKEAIS